MIHKKLSLSLLLIMMTAIPESARDKYYEVQKKLSDLQSQSREEEVSEQGTSNLKNEMDDIYSTLSLKDKLLVNAENHKKKVIAGGIAAAVGIGYGIFRIIKK